MRNCIVLVVIALLGLFSCVSTVEKNVEQVPENALIPNELIVEYAPLIDTDSAYGFSLSEFQKDELDMVDFTFEKVLAGDISVNKSYIGDVANYNNDTTVLTLEEIKRVLGMGPQTLSYEKDGEEVFETFENEFVADEIIRISFVESWHLSMNDFKLTKDVLRYDFVREYEREDNGPKYYVKTFGIIKNDSLKAKWNYIGSKVTEANISVLSKDDNEEMPESLKNEIWEDFVALDHSRNILWNYYAYKKFIDAMFGAIELGKVKAYDLKTKAEMNWNEVEAKMGAGITTVSYMDENGYEISKTIELELVPTEVRSILFFEDWYMDKQTLAIKKEIKGIAPVRFYSKDQENIEKEIVFVIWYNTPK